MPATRTAVAIAAGVAALASFPGHGSAQLVPAIGAEANATPNSASASAVSMPIPGVPLTGAQAPAPVVRATDTNGNPPRFVPPNLPPALPTISPDPQLAHRDARAVSLATRWRQRSCGTRMGPDGFLHFIQGACEPVVVCAVYKVCIVALEPGENITDKPDLGDPRWITHPRVSGTGADRTIHISIKPADAGLDTNMVIPTDRRLVSVRLVSTAARYMPYVVLDNPEASSNAAWASVIGQGARAQAASQGGVCDQPPVIPPAGFDVRGRAPWKPSVYTVSTPVGSKTCIEFPADVGSMDLPVLVASDAAGQEQVTQYRMIGRRFLVDRVLDHGMLVAGVGRGQEKVTIERRGYR